MARTPAKYCDLVMKGGITSGIVYPNAALALARDYRFKNIGGTSAGAIAAAACAAAAVGDRRKQMKAAIAQPEERVGFEGLAKASANLASPGFIKDLLQPAAGAGQAFRLLVTLAGNTGVLRKGVALLGSVVRIAPVETLLLLAALAGLAYAVGGQTGMIAAALPAAICAYLGGVVFAVLRIARVLRRNLMGLCTGTAPDQPARRPRMVLTDWPAGTVRQGFGPAPHLRRSLDGGALPRRTGLRPRRYPEDDHDWHIAPGAAQPAVRKRAFLVPAQGIRSAFSEGRRRLDGREGRGAGHRGG